VNTRKNAGVNHPGPALPAARGRERGTGLVVVIMLLAFMMTVGMVLLSTVRTGPEIAGTLRLQRQAFDAAESGFNAAWLEVGRYFVSQDWTSFDGHYVQEPYGIDIPQDEKYFRRQTDEELLAMVGDFSAGSAGSANVIYYKEFYIHTASGLDPRYSYTVFLIDDEAAGSEAPDAGDALMVCIGAVELGGRISTARIEIELVVELPGT